MLSGSKENPPSNPNQNEKGTLNFSVSGFESQSSAKSVNIAITAVDGSSADNRTIDQPLAGSTSVQVAGLAAKTYKIVLQLLDADKKVLASGAANSVTVKAGADVPVKISLTSNPATGKINIDINVLPSVPVPAVAAECEKIWADGVRAGGQIWRKLPNGKACTDFGAGVVEESWTSAMNIAPAQCPLPVSFESYNGGWEPWNKDLWELFNTECQKRGGISKGPQWGQDPSPSRGAGCTTMTPAWRFCVSEDPAAFVYQQRSECGSSDEMPEDRLCPNVMPEKAAQNQLCSTRGITAGMRCSADKRNDFCVISDTQCVNGKLQSQVYLQCVHEGHEQKCPTSRRAAKEQIHYLADEERKQIADKILDLKLTTYRYKPGHGNSSEPQMGFIIDDVQQAPFIMPNGDRVNLYGYISAAVITLQQQQAMIEQLQDRIHRLEAESRQNISLSPIAIPAKEERP